jgi:hypothetical protein
MVELPPYAMHLDEPSGRPNSKLDPNRGSFAKAFFTSHEEMIVIVAVCYEIVERHTDKRWPAK